MSIPSRNLLNPSKKTTNITIENPIGLPPTNSNVTEFGQGPNMGKVVKDSMPMIEIYPCLTKFNESLEFYRLQNGMHKPVGSEPSYKSELADLYGVNLKIGSEVLYLKAAFLNVNPPTESFSNDFGQSVFDNLTNISQGMTRELAFATGLTSGQAAAAAIKSKLPENMSKALDAATSGMSSGLDKMGTIGSIIKKGVGTASRLAMGSRLDFPQSWKSSSWSPSYSVHIRLYNPDPQDETATNKFIVGPLAALMMFVVPRSSDGVTYSWPWLCKYKVEGLFDIQAGYVKNIQIVKGGDDNSIAYNQRCGIVDVKIDFGTLYESMINTTGTISSDKPALDKWLNQFSTKKKWQKSKSIISLSDEGGSPNKVPDWLRYQYSSILGKTMVTVNPSMNVNDQQLTNQNLMDDTTEFDFVVTNIKQSPDVQTLSTPLTRNESANQSPIYEISDNPYDVSPENVNNTIDSRMFNT